MMIIMVYIVLVIFLVSIYHYNLHYGKKGRLLNLIPGPPALPLLGNILLVIVPTKKLLQRICNIHDQYYPIMRFWLCHMPFIILRDPDDIKIILDSKKQIEKNVIYKVLQQSIGDGLGFSKGSKWHIRRKLLAPSFHNNILKQFVDVFIEESNSMVMTLKDARGPVVKEILPLMTEHSLNIICGTAMGVSLKNSAAAQEFCRNIQQLGELVTYKFTRIWMHNEWISTMLSSGRKLRKLLSFCNSFINQIIAERKQYHERTNGRYLKNIENDTSAQVDDAENNGNTKKRLVLLDFLIAMSQENNLTDSDITEEVNMFIVAGFDTTSMALYFALLMLAKHKDVQDRVRLEVNNMFKENSKVTMSSLQNLPYLDRCIKEIFRLYPSVPLIGRLTTEDIKLHSYTVPTGTNVLLNIYAMHRDPKFWPNPELFDPDRFLPERSTNRHPYSYLPFSAGPRNCIGYRFALLEMKATIASLIHNFYLEPVGYLNDIEVMMKIALCPTHPSDIRFIPIDTNY